MAVYRHENLRGLADISSESRLSNQVVFNGSTENTLSVPKGIVFIEFIKAESGGSIEVKDGNDVSMLSGLTDFSQDHSPLRCDRGVTLVGDLECAKGFVLDGIFAT